MTTTVSITNHGPGRVRVRLRDISLSARRNDSDNGEVILNSGETSTGYQASLYVYDTRKLIIEEVSE